MSGETSKERAERRKHAKGLMKEDLRRLRDELARFNERLAAVGDQDEPCKRCAGRGTVISPEDGAAVTDQVQCPDCAEVQITPSGCKDLALGDQDELRERLLEILATRVGFDDFEDIADQLVAAVLPSVRGVGRAMSCDHNCVPCSKWFRRGWVCVRCGEWFRALPERVRTETVKGEER